MKIRRNNECYLGNPSIPADIDGIGSADVWEPVIRIQTKAYKYKNKYKNKKIKMKNLNDKKILNQLVEKYTANGVLSAINRLYENEEFEYNGYTPAMIQSLKDDGYIEEDATFEEIKEFIDDKCMAFWAEDPSDLAIQYVDEMIGYEDYNSLADFITRFNCLDYASIGSDYKINTSPDEYEEDAELQKMDDYSAGKVIVEDFYGADDEKSMANMIKNMSEILDFSSYIDFGEAGDNMLMQFDYTTGTDENGDNFYILIFY